MPELVHPAQLDPRLADLTRPPSTGVTGGLCRALAGRWQVDPIIVRLVTVALTFAGGVGVALYAWGWLLTPRVGGQPPILRWLPAFGRWTRNTQTIIVAVSSLVLVLSVARQTGVGWGPVIVVGALAWAMARRRRNTAAPSVDQASTPHTPSPAAPSPSGNRNAAETVAQWRAGLAPHTGAPLPAVDLYAPEHTRPLPVAPGRRPQPKSWLAAAVILLLMAGAAAVPLGLGLDPAILWAGVAASGAAAVSILLFSLVVRSRRLPMPLLVLVLAGTVGTGLLAVNESTTPQVVSAHVVGDDMFYQYFGEAPAELDLTMLPADEATTVVIDATASVVQVSLKASPGNVSVNSDTIVVDTSYLTRSYADSQVDLIIEGSFSVVEIEIVP